MRYRSGRFGDAWWKAGLRRRIVVVGLLLALTTGYLTGSALVVGSHGPLLESWTSRSVDAGWTVLMLPGTPTVGDPHFVKVGRPRS